MASVWLVPLVALMISSTFSMPVAKRLAIAENQNSVKYIEHVLDLWDLDWYKAHSIRRFEIAYVAEAHQGDQLSFYREQTGDQEYCVRIVRSDGTECCRSKVSFR